MSENTPLTSSLELPCGAVLSNRFGKSAMTEGLADEFDNATQEHVNLYQTWTDGGLGLSISGNVMVDRRYLERAGNIVLEDDQGMAQLKQMAEAGKSEKTHFWMQISHPGRQCPRMVNSEPLAPSAVQLNLLGNFSKPRAMTEDDIADVIQRFTTTAGLAKQAGFTGVQIHCAHGYLVSQFLNPLVNQREDKWGGSLENRARLARELVRAVRAEVGPDFPVAVKLNSADFQKGGFTIEECVQVAQWLAEDSLDLLEISGGNYEQPSLMGMESKEVRESTRKREAYFIEYAAAIKAAAKIPLMVTGGFRNRSVMENALQNDGIDVIGLARPFCTEPNLVEDLIEGRITQLPDHEERLVMGKGWLGNNSRFNSIRSINGFGQVGFYYYQIIRLANNQPLDLSLKVFNSFVKHIRNDFRLVKRRQKAQQDA